MKGEGSLDEREASTGLTGLGGKDQAMEVDRGMAVSPRRIPVTIDARD